MRPSIGRRTAIAGIGGLLAAPAVVRAQGQNGAALVIGNSKYLWEAHLPNVRRDAPDIAKRFQALGLKTELLQDLGLDAMRQAIDKFRTASRGANLAALYFAGHGASWERDTYLVPVDADLSAPSIVKSLISVPSIRDAMGEAAHRLLVFDSCRNNPADGWRQLEATRRGAGDNVRLPATGAPNTLVLYSTAPGRVALDGPAGENSPFAAAFLRQLGSPSVDLQALPANLRRDLLIATQARQILWDQNTYQQPFQIRGTGAGTTAGGSGWNRDPSRIIELSNAYAFAQANGLLLPPGLIAHRPAGNSRDASKVGAFKFESLTPRGERVPSVLLVLSVEEQQSAEIILAGKNAEGVGWYFRTGTLSGNRLEVDVVYGGPHSIFDWRDANSGSFSLIGNKLFTTSFTRLDG